MLANDPITEALMSPGAPFEVVSRAVQGRQLRVFRHAPDTLVAIFERARAFGKADFLVAGEQRLTYDDFFKHADAVSSWLTAQPYFSPGTSVAISMKNCPEWMMAFVGIIQAGGVAVLINSRGTGKNMAQAVADTDTRLIFADPKRAEQLRASGCDVPTILSTELAGLSGPDFERPSRSADDLAAMFFTSGTTGTAKAAAISHRALVTGVMNTQMAMAAVFQKMAADYGVDLETLRQQMPQSCSLLIFPLFHVSGCSAVFLTAFANGGKLVMMNRWDAQNALRLIESEKITTFGGVPSMHWDMLQAKSHSDADLSSLMSISCGGQALPLNLLAAIRKEFPRAFIGAGYGMTEMTGAISQANGEALLAKPESSGRILPMMDVQISDEKGQALPTGEVGEIWAKGAAMMSAYYGRPDDTSRSMSGDWFKTGDIGRVDEDGYIYIVDRKTDMVISSGENIYCAEVEQAMGRHPDILQVTTFGIPDDRLGERLVASVVLREGSANSKDIQAFAREHLAAYKVPTDIHIVDEPFELNAMGKVEKHKVRTAFIAARKTS